MWNKVPTRASAENLIDSAARMIRIFGGPTVDRDQAAVLLAGWGHRGSLSLDDQAAVLDRFGGQR